MNYATAFKTALISIGTLVVLKKFAPLAVRKYL